MRPEGREPLPDKAGESTLLSRSGGEKGLRGGGAGKPHAKIGSIKDKNGMDVTEAEGIKKKWQEYTEELYKKDLHDLDNHDGVVTHLHQTSWNVKSSGP